MDEQRQEAYLNLINQLLGCPSGEESEILKANRDLVDAKLVLTMLEVANALGGQGNLEGDNFLMNIAGYLMGVYGNLPLQKLSSSTATSSKIENSDSQLDFLLQVLQATADSNDNPQVVYPLLSANLDKLDEHFATIMRCWATSALSQAVSQQAYGMAVNIGNFSTLIKDFPLGNRASNLEIAITGHEVIALIMTRSQYPYEWAMAKNNLGTAYLDRIRGNRAENLTAAIGHFRSALEVYTREAFPQEWAMAQCNLGLAHLYSYDIQEKPQENLETAIGHFDNALEVATREAFPQKWAMLQNNLAEAYFERICGEKAENLEAAINYHLAALEVFTREAFPEQWASNQCNLSFCYSSRIRGEKAENLKVAIHYASAALDVYTQEAFPKKWADTQVALGNAYRQCISGEKAENLEVAIYHYSAAWQVYTCQAFPRDWALVQYNLGNAFYQRIRGEKKENLEVAIHFYSAALVVYTRESFPKDWARVQNNLGGTYAIRILGERTENLEIAIDYFRNALEVYTREALPEGWARTQIDIGEAYRQRVQGETAENLKTAIQHFLAALEVCTREAFPIYWAIIQNNLGISYLDMGTSCLGAYFVYRTQKEQEEDLEKAIGCLLNALEVHTREAFPVDWARIQYNLGLCYMHRIRGKKAENLEAAIRGFSYALNVHTYEAFPFEWAWLQSGLGEAYRQRIQGEKEENLKIAISCNLAALQVFTRAAFPENYLRTQFNLGLCYQNALQFQNAYTAFAAAIDTIESLCDEIVSRNGKEENKQKLAERWSQLYKQMVLACLELGNYAAAIEYAERSKTRNLVELILNRDLHAIFPPEIVSQLEQLRDEISRGQHQLQTATADDPTALARNLQKLRQQRNELQDRYLPVGHGFKFDQFQATLDEHTAIVQWYITGAKLLTFIFTSQTQQPIVWQSEPKDLKKLQKWSHGYRRAYKVYRSSWQRRLSTRLDLLAKILHINEIVEQILEECDNLILIPHWELHLFPLHALPISTQHGEPKSKILMDRFPRGVCYAPSCQLLQLAQTRIPNRTNFTHFFAIQNPTSDLTYAGWEVQVIKSYFESANILEKDAATKTALDNTPLNKVHCAHFSCHGYFHLANPRKSPLILADAHLKAAPAELDPEHYLLSDDDGVLDLDKCLTLDTIFTLNLEKCRLVTLSACETGLIDFQNISDEYIGLPSGFLYAGSSCVVSSLWMVDDLSTAFLIIKFYENLQGQISVAVALNQAQSWLRDSTKAELEHWIEQKQLPLSPTLRIRQFKGVQPNDKPFQAPFHWAAFCAIGQ